MLARFAPAAIAALVLCCGSIADAQMIGRGNRTTQSDADTKRADALREHAAATSAFNDAVDQLRSRGYADPGTLPAMRIATQKLNSLVHIDRGDYAYDRRFWWLAHSNYQEVESRIFTARRFIAGALRVYR